MALRVPLLVIVAGQLWFHMLPEPWIVLAFTKVAALQALIWKVFWEKFVRVSVPEPESVVVCPAGIVIWVVSPDELSVIVPVLVTVPVKVTLLLSGTTRVPVFVTPLNVGLP